MVKEALLGLDLGTSSLKTLLLTTDGHVMGSSEAPYETLRPRPGWAEQDPDAWWEAACAATRSLLTAQPASVVGIGLSGQMHTVVITDTNGQPIRPAITWMDTRAVDLIDALRAQLGAADLLTSLANPVLLGLSLPVLVWLRRYEPESWARAAAVVSAKDYLRWRATGELGSEPTDASATLMFDVAHRGWLDALAPLLDRPTGWWPRLGAPDAIAGHLTDIAAAALGLRPGIPVAYGAGDQQAAGLGNGRIRPGHMQLMVGTGAQIIGVRDRAVADLNGRLHLFCHVRGWIHQASINNAGNALAWVRQVLSLDWSALYGAPRRGKTPIFIPYLLGERARTMRPHAKGAWLRLAPEHDQHDLARAAVDGVVASIADGIELVLETGPADGPIVAAGGGIRHPDFARDVADAAGVPVAVSTVRDASAVGAALLGSVAAGVFPNLEMAVATTLLPPTIVHVPNAERRAMWATVRRQLRDIDASGIHEVLT